MHADDAAEIADLHAPDNPWMSYVFQVQDDNIRAKGPGALNQFGLAGRDDQPGTSHGLCHARSPEKNLCVAVGS